MSFFGKTTSGGLANISINGAIKTDVGVYTFAGKSTTPSGTGKVVLAGMRYAGFYQVSVVGNRGNGVDFNCYLYASVSWVPNGTSPLVNIQNTNVPANTWKVEIENDPPDIVFISSTAGDVIWWNITCFPSYTKNGIAPG